MSMLAERKRKQKWSLNPRGKEWSQDANKFGQKMLEKMGWQSGKGLGAKEDGIKEHIKISYKNDSRGMGYKESNDQWTEHETNFSALLESLTGKESEVEKNKVISLEQKSQKSRARVHYKKFTRGKDLSQYSEKDLANIFGKKSLTETKVKVELKEESGSDSKENQEGNDFLVNAGSMKDYFKKKLPNFGKSNGYTIGSNGVLQKQTESGMDENKSTYGFGFNTKLEMNSESESEMRPSFGLGFNASDSLKQTKANKETSESDNDSKETKKMSFVSYISETPVKRSAEDQDDTVLSSKKKSKKDRTKKGKNETVGLSNPAFAPMGTPVQIQRHSLNPIEESVTEVDESVRETVKKKSKKKKDESECSANNLEESPRKKKKSNKSCSVESKIDQTLEGISNPAFNPMGTPVKVQRHKLTVIEESVTEIEESITNSNSKKKHKNSITPDKMEKVSNNCIENNISKKNKNDSKTEIKESVGAAVTEENPYEISTKRIKKEKKRRKNTENNEETLNTKNKTNDISGTAIDNPNFDETEDVSTNCLEVEENPYEVKVKKKNKKSKTLEIINPNFDDTEEDSVNISQVEENPYEVKPREKKKKKKDKKLALDNPGFLDQTEEIVNSINPYEVKPKGKKKITSKEPGIVNPAIDLNDSKIDENLDLGECDLMLNIVSTPVRKEEDTNISSIGSVNKVESVKSRRSVRFSNVTQEFIIPNNDELKEMAKKDKKKKKGLDNVNFDKGKTNLEENVATIAKTLDNFQAEIENDINEEKIKEFTTEDFMVGEVGNPHGENEKVTDGTKLKFKYANLFTKTPLYMLNQAGARKSYKHLIKGDILVKFKNTNLHEIKGYATRDKNEV